MLHSFLTQNRWFDGDIVVFHDGLTENSQLDFTANFDRIRLLSISTQLKSSLKKLIAFKPDLTSRQARFYSLEVFRLTDYDKVLFCDSDLLFCQSVSHLFKMKQALICTGDGSYYRGNGRDTTTFSEIELTADRSINELRQTFNAGFLLIDALLLKEKHYAGLLALLSKQTWQLITANHTDQVIYNLYFNGQQELVGSEYNYMLQHRATLFAKEQVTLAKASVLHFNGPAKPWQSKQILTAVHLDAALIQAIKLWYDAHIACLTHMYLKGHEIDTPMNDNV